MISKQEDTSAIQTVRPFLEGLTEQPLLSLAVADATSPVIKTDSDFVKLSKFRDKMLDISNTLKLEVLQSRETKTLVSKMKAAVDPSTWTNAGLLAEMKKKDHGRLDAELKMLGINMEQMLALKIPVDEILGEGVPPKAFGELPKALSIHIAYLRKQNATSDEITSMIKFKESVEQVIRLMTGKITNLEKVADGLITAGVVMADLTVTLATGLTAVGAVGVGVVLATSFVVAAAVTTVFETMAHLSGFVINPLRNAFRYCVDKASESLFVTNPFVSRAKGVHEISGIMNEIQLATFKTAAVNTIINDVIFNDSSKSENEMNEQITALKALKNGDNVIFSSEEMGSLMDNLRENKEKYTNGSLDEKIAIIEADLASAKAERKNLAELLNKKDPDALKLDQQGAIIGKCKIIHDELTKDIQERMTKLRELKSDAVTENRKTLKDTLKDGMTGRIAGVGKKAVDKVSKAYDEVSEAYKDAKELEKVKEKASIKKTQEMKAKMPADPDSPRSVAGALTDDDVRSPMHPSTPSKGGTVI